MPELLMERPKMSLQMHETLKRYILRERRRRIEEDVANEQKMREELVSETPFTKILTQFISFNFKWNVEKGRNEHANVGTSQATT